MFINTTLNLFYEIVELFFRNMNRYQCVNCRIINYKILLKIFFYFNFNSSFILTFTFKKKRLWYVLEAVLHRYHLFHHLGNNRIVEEYWTDILDFHTS